MKATKKGDFVGMYKGKKGKINGLIVKRLKYNLLSVRKLAQNNYKMTFDMKSIEVVSKNHKLYCKRENNLYTCIS